MSCVHTTPYWEIVAFLCCTVYCGSGRKERDRGRERGKLNTVKLSQVFPALVSRQFFGCMTIVYGLRCMYCNNKHIVKHNNIIVKTQTGIQIF